MLLDSIRSLFGAKSETPSTAARKPVASGEPAFDPLHLAACTLLLDVAYADGEFSEAERAQLEAVLDRHFQLPPESGSKLMALAEAERGESIDHFRFTSQLQKGYDTGQKMVLAEIMWGIVLADGQIAEHEQYLTRKIANLLGLAPGYLSAAKAAASEKGGQ